MAEFKWDVYPYQYVTELVNRYTNVVMSTTISKAKERSTEAAEWMRANASWQDRTPAMRALAAKYGAKIPGRHARQALHVRINTDPNVERHYQGMRREAYRQDATALKTENIRRASLNESRPPSRQLQSWTSLPKSRSRVAKIGREIRVMRGPIVELKFSHGKDIWYGVWLEIAKQGRYSIIDKAVAHWSPILMNDIKQIANLVQFNITFSEEVRTEADVFVDRMTSEDRRFIELGDERRYQPWTAEKAATVRERRKRENRYQRGLRKEAAAQAERLAAEEARKQAAFIRKHRGEEQTFATYEFRTGKKGTFKATGR